MHVTFDNVNDAFPYMVSGFKAREFLIPFGDSIPVITSESRNGPVLNIPEPVTVTYTKPNQCVLFNPVRDCNPFFHLVEAMWMLAGRNDVASLIPFASNMANYSDNGETLNGAYGYRWRSHWFDGESTYFDQLEFLIQHLTNNPESRRAVLQMWNVENDLLKVDDSHRTYSKDVCCNTEVIFTTRKVEYKEEGGFNYTDTILDMTVVNRSNDLIWGMMGANVVHFSFLHKFMSEACRLTQGNFHTMSTNLHVYTETNSGFEPDKLLDHYRVDLRDMHAPPMFENLYSTGMIAGGTHLFNSAIDNVSRIELEAFDRDLKRFFSQLNSTHGEDEFEADFESQFIERTMVPAVVSFRKHKLRDYDEAYAVVDTMLDLDWRIACKKWLERREANWKEKNSSQS